MNRFEGRVALVTGASRGIGEAVARRLADGSTHRVLKNFPGREEVVGVVGRHRGGVQSREWEYFWAVEYCCW